MHTDSFRTLCHATALVTLELAARAAAGMLLLGLATAAVYWGALGL